MVPGSSSGFLTALVILMESCTVEGSLLQLVLLLWPKIDRVLGRTFFTFTTVRHLREAKVQNLEQLITLLLLHSANSLQGASDHVSYPLKPLLHGKFLRVYYFIIITIDILQTMFSAVSRPSFSTLAFSDLVEPTMTEIRTLRTLKRSENNVLCYTISLGTGM